MLAFAGGMCLSACAWTGGGPSPALWRVQADNGNQMWVFGSIHRLPDEYQPAPPVKLPVSNRLRRPFPRAPWLTSTLQTAFRDASTIMVETVEAPSFGGLITLAAEHDRLGDCDPITQHLGRKQNEHLESLLGRRTGESRTFPDSAPAILLSLVAFRSGRGASSSNMGVDFWLTQLARGNGKQIIALETPVERLEAMQAALAVLPCDRQAQQIAAYLRTLDQDSPVDRSQPTITFRQWLHGDIAALERAIEEYRAQSEVLFQALLARRNQQWASRVLQQLDSQHSTLLVAGAAHFAGPDNLLQILENKGLSVERVQ
ncbi:MAG: TraB/GumN family protein [Wenzhouxiangellaceae bacterium]